MKQSSAINNPFCLCFNVLNNLYIQYHFTGQKKTLSRLPMQMSNFSMELH